jgi:hypothetical protein
MLWEKKADVNLTKKYEGGGATKYWRTLCACLEMSSWFSVVKEAEAVKLYDGRRWKWCCDDQLWWTMVHSDEEGKCWC